MEWIIVHFFSISSLGFHWKLFDVAIIFNYVVHEHDMLFPYLTVISVRFASLWSYLYVHSSPLWRHFVQTCNIFENYAILIIFFFILFSQVRDLVEKCTCPSQFPMIRVSEGKYRIGDTKVLIFVRVSNIFMTHSIIARK